MDPERIDDAAHWAGRRLRDWIAVPSVSTEGTALEEGAAFASALLEEAGLTTERLAGPGAPVVLGSRPAPPGRPTVLIYGHYDVQPAEPLEAWSTPPFVGTLRDGAIFGRGAGDNKGQLIAHLAALRDLLRRNELPVGVRVLVEGEEEIGSPHVGAVVERHRERLAADLAITSDAPGDGERPVVIFGVRGLLYVQIDHHGASADLHSGNRGGIAPSPAWELVNALAELRRPDGRVVLPGFEEAIRPPNEVEERMLADLPTARAALRAELGVDRLSSDPGEPWRALMFRPNCNLAGLTAGYSGPGAKTVIPRHASCKIDFRLVADQEPDAVFSALERWLRDRLPQARLRKVAAVPPSATDPGHPLCRAVVDAVREAHGTEPLLRPRLGGTTPDWLFTRLLGIPSVLVPYGPPDMNHHAPDERMTLTALREGIVSSVAIYRAVAEVGGDG